MFTVNYNILGKIPVLRTGKKRGPWPMARRPWPVARGTISLNPNFGINRSINEMLGNTQTDRQTNTQTHRSSFYIDRLSILERGNKAISHILK